MKNKDTTFGVLGVPEAMMNGCKPTYVYYHAEADEFLCLEDPPVKVQGMEYVVAIYAHDGQQLEDRFKGVVDWHRRELATASN